MINYLKWVCEKLQYLNNSKQEMQENQFFQIAFTLNWIFNSMFSI